MTPKDFQAWYNNLSPTATTPDGGSSSFSGLAVTRYEMYDDQKSLSRAVAIDSIKAMAEAQNLAFQNSGANSPGWAIAVDTLAFAYAKISRASPAQLESILSTALGCNFFGTNPTQDTLQGFVDDNFRTDCVGFVSSYFRSERGEDFFSRNDVSNHGCGPFYDKAVANGQFIWDLTDIQMGDVLLWMYENRKECRRPGHISLVQNVILADDMNQVLNCVESNGSPTTDPKSTSREINWGIGGSPGSRYIQLSRGTPERERIIVVRLN